MPGIHRVARPLYYVAVFPDRNAGIVPLTVQFDSLIAGGKAPFTYSWDFGDDATSAEPKPQHTYTRTGNFVVKLTVTDRAGVSAETTYRITVYIPLPTINLTLEDLTYVMTTDVRDALSLGVNPTYVMDTEVRDARSLNVNPTYAIDTEVRDALSLGVDITYTIEASVE